MKEKYYLQKKMSVSNKKKAGWIIAGVAGLVLLFFLVNLYVKNKIEQQLGEQLQVTAYKDLSVNILFNRFSVENLKLDQKRFSGNIEKVKLSGLSYSEYLFNNNIVINEFELVRPQITVFPKDSSAKETSGQQKLQIKNLRVKNGKFSRQSADTTETMVYAHVASAAVENIHSGMQLSNINSYQLEVDSLFLKMNPEHYIDVGRLSAKNGQVEISDFKIRSFFNRKEFVQRIPYEKDYVRLDVNEIKLCSLHFEMRKDSLYLRNSKMTLAGANLNIYRNKLVADYPNVKPLYSKMLRNAPIFINFEKVVVNNSEIVYEEQVKAGEQPAIVRFAAVKGEVDELHNLKELSSQPRITASADFMQCTPVSIDWTFPVFNAQDKFQISGNFGTIQGEALDPFLVPSLNARARGTINSVYFNFFGNDDVMQGDFRMEYDDLKVELLTKKKEEKKGFLSAIANLFVDNEQEPEEGGSYDVQVERTKNKSFWNFAWKGLREGLLDAVGQL